MLTSSGTGAIPPVGFSKISYINTEKDGRIHAVQSGNYDSISFSSSASDENRFYNELVGRLSQEVRTATTTGDIRAIGEEVSSGNYVPDPMAIAARIMFLGEDT